MSDSPTTLQLEGLPIPDPSLGANRKKARLIELAKEHGILRIAAEKGLNVDDATRFIEKYGDRIKGADFPTDSYGLLK